MTLLKWRVFSAALILTISVIAPGVVTAQDAQPMSQISLGGSSSNNLGGGSMDGFADNTSFGGDVGTDGIATVSTAGPEAAAFDGTYVWVATQFNNAITRIRVSDGTLAGTFTVGKRPVALLYAGGSLWVANLLSNNVMKINTSTGAIAGTYAVGDGPGGLAYDGSSIWVANRHSNNVTKLSTKGSVLGSFAVGKRPIGLAFAANSIWVANNFSN
jgi:hypothetical protein